MEDLLAREEEHADDMAKLFQAFSQIDSSDAIKASPSHNAAKAQIPVIVVPCLHVSRPQRNVQAVLGLNNKKPAWRRVADLTSHRIVMMR
mgnify:CR=1 FL=1